MPKSLTPFGQVTIPRPIMKLLGIRADSRISIEVENNCLVLKKIDADSTDKKELVYKVG